VVITWSRYVIATRFVIAYFISRVQGPVAVATPACDIDKRDCEMWGASTNSTLNGIRLHSHLTSTGAVSHSFEMAAESNDAEKPQIRSVNDGGICLTASDTVHASLQHQTLLNAYRGGRGIVRLRSKILACAASIKADRMAAVCLLGPARQASLTLINLGLV